MNALILVFVVTIVGSWGYNFDNEDYNLLLAQDLEDFYSEPQAVPARRIRREENFDSNKCHRRFHSRSCCAENAFHAMHEKEKDTKRECFREIHGNDRNGDRGVWSDPFKCENIEKRRRDMICATQCYLHKKNITDANGKIRENVLKTHLKNSFQNEEWLQPKIDEIAIKCISQARVYATVKAGEDEDPAACNTEGIKLGYCIYKEIQLACPADQIKDAKQCDRIKERLTRSDGAFWNHKYVNLDEEN